VSRVILASALSPEVRVWPSNVLPTGDGIQLYLNVKVLWDILFVDYLISYIFM